MGNRLMQSPRFPIGWLTVLAFVTEAVATLDLIVGAFFVAVVLPAVLALQWIIRWVFNRFGGRVWVRRVVMLLPALILAFNGFRATNAFGGKNVAAVRVALAGNKPKGIQDLHVHVDAWTDYVVVAYFRCESTSLQRILERPPFIQLEGLPRTISFRDMPFPDLRNRPDLADVIVYKRTDLGDGLCSVYTDAGFTFAYIKYAVD